MTTIYFVRHAQPNYENHDDMSRELTTKGISDSKLVTEFLLDKNIDVIISSPFKRAVDTVKDFAQRKNLDISTDFNLRERKIGDNWLDNFDDFAKMQWSDFNYKLHNGESLNEVQARNILSLNTILKEYANKNIVVGTHGTALSTIVNYYDNNFKYEDFHKIKSVMPWIVKIVFDNYNCINIEKINIFS